jgi:hypothetical protein
MRMLMTQQAMKESQVATTEKYIMTTAKEPTDNDFERMMHMITGYWVNADSRCCG